MTDRVGSDNRTESYASVLHDRRRPGRKEVDPSLIPLLRGQVSLEDVTEPAAPPEPAGADLLWPVRDDLAPVVGIARGLGLVCVAGVGLALLELL